MMSFKAPPQTEQVGPYIEIGQTDGRYDIYLTDLPHSYRVSH